MALDVAKIKLLRIKAGLTQQEAGELAGYSDKSAKQAWSRIESGRQVNPTLDVLDRIAKVLGCKVPDLLK